MNVIAPYQVRVINEKNELYTRLEKLNDFLKSEAFNTISIENQDLLIEQYGVMQHLFTILEKRINLF